MKYLKDLRVFLGTRDRISGIGLLLFASGILWESRQWPMGTLQSPGPAFMPVLLAVLLGGTGILIFFSSADSPKLGSFHWDDAGHAVSILGVCVFTALALERLGYCITTILTLIFLLGVIERQRLFFVLTLSFSLSMGFYLLFNTVLRVRLPKSPLGF